MRGIERWVKQHPRSPVADRLGLLGTLTLGSAKHDSACQYRGPTTVVWRDFVFASVNKYTEWSRPLAAELFVPLRR